MASFERDIWPKIIEIAEDKKAKREPFFTITKKTENTVLEIRLDRIKVQSAMNRSGGSGGAERWVTKECLKRSWSFLKETGQLNVAAMDAHVLPGSGCRWTGCIILGILSELHNYVTIEKIGRTMTLVYKQRRR